MSTLTSTAGLPRLRPDVVVMPDGETGRGRIVKDPRTRRYYRFDELEGFILEHLDGQHTAVDIQVALAEQLDEAFALDELQDFLDTLREKGLTDDGHPLLPVCAPALAEQFVTALETQGIELSSGGLDRRLGIPLAPHEAALAEKFDEAVGYLRAGRFTAALRAFDELLAANPGDQRAASLRALLVQVGGAAALAALETQKEGPRQSPLYYRVPLFDPDRLFARVEPWLRFAWTRGFLALYVLVVGFAGLVFATRGRAVFTGLPPLPGGAWALAFIATAVVMIALHECAHGLTCKHFGGKVHETGVLLIFFFMPAFYVDVTDAWMFRRKLHRALVGMAGPLWDTFAGSCATLLAVSLAPGYGRVLAVAVMSTAFASVVINLNPLMKLDGYYILSDLAGIPNLKAAGSRALWRALRRGADDGPPLTRRTRVLLFVYGLFSTVYAVAILWILVRLAFGLSTSAAGLWGPVVLVGGVLWLARRALAALGRGISNAIAGLTPRRTLTLAIAGAVIAAAALISIPLRVGGPAALEARARGPVRAIVSGNIADVLVREGDHVERGQPVARLDTRELEAQLSIVRAGIARGQAELQLLERGPAREQLAQAREKIHAASAEVEQLGSRHDRLTRLRAEGLVAADLYEQSQKDLTVSQGALRSVTEEAHLLQRGARPEQLDAARADVARIEAERTDIERRLAACTLYAPESGTVVTAQPETKRGEYVAAGGLVLEIADTRTLTANLDVLESDIGEVARGQRVALHFAAYPDRTFTGVVDELAPVAKADPLGRAIFRVRCSVEDASGALRPGMTGAAKIACGRRTALSIAVRRLLRMVDPSLL